MRKELERKTSMTVQQSLGRTLSRSLLLGSLLLSAGTLIACAPSMHKEIDKAEASLTQLKQQLPAETLAGREVRDAEEAVARAKTAWRSDPDQEEALHLSYLAGKRIEIAFLATRAAQAEQQAAVLNQQRGVARLAGEKSKAEMQLADVKSRARRQRAALQSMEVELEELKAEQTNRGLELTLGDVLFQTDKAELKPGAIRRLQPLARHLRKNSDLAVRIEGHTDSQGSAEYNENLSRQRAESVKSALIGMQVEPHRIEAVGLGKDYPVTTNDTQAGRQENRRVELVIAGSNTPTSVTRTESMRRTTTESIRR